MSANLKLILSHTHIHSFDLAHIKTNARKREISANLKIILSQVRVYGFCVGFVVDFGCHELRRAQNAKTKLRAARGQSHVPDADIARGAVDENVIALYVTMDDPTHTHTHTHTLRQVHTHTHTETSTHTHTLRQVHTHTENGYTHTHIETSTHTH